MTTRTNKQTTKALISLLLSICTNRLAILKPIHCGSRHTDCATLQVDNCTPSYRSIGRRVCNGSRSCQSKLKSSKHTTNISSQYSNHVEFDVRLRTINSQLSGSRHNFAIVVLRETRIVASVVELKALEYETSPICLPLIR